jgi:hypothetical protein
MVADNYSRVALDPVPTRKECNLMRVVTPTRCVLACLVFFASAGDRATAAEPSAGTATQARLTASQQRASRNSGTPQDGSLDKKIAGLKARKDVAELRSLIPDPGSAEGLRAMLAGEDNSEPLVKVGIALFALGDYPWLFRNFIHLGDGPRGTGYRMLTTIGGTAISKTAEFLPQADVGFDNAGYALEQIVAFFEDQGVLRANSNLFERFMEPSCQEKVRAAALPAVMAGRIVAAEPNVRALLASENPYVRRRAVWTLAELGQEASLPALQGVAESDPAFRLTKDGTATKEFFVRTAALAAVQKISDSRVLKNPADRAGGHSGAD